MLFNCYFDDSGNKQDGFTAVAGLVSNWERWRSFAEEWLLMLARYRVPEFKMKELSHFKGMYKDWEPETKDNFQAEACAIIARNTLYGFASIVPHEVFNRVNERYTLKEYVGNPYALAGISCVRNAARWARKEYPKGAIEFFFDDGTEKRGHLVRLMKAERFEEPIFRSPVPRNGFRAVTQLQAADFYAYEVRKVRIDDPNETRAIEDHRISLRKLIWVDSEWGQYSESDLVATCEGHPKIKLRK